MASLPIEDILPALLKTLAARPNVVLAAPPGAGKTTRVPLALLDAPWQQGKAIVMLEPRRLAARAAAYRMASSLHESVGETVGYRMRLDTKVSPRTRIEVVTEGILTRLLQDDPALSRYAAILFDEFHERSLQADTGLALSLEAQRLFRPDLRLLVMSATLDCGPVSTLLGEAPVLACEGRLFPVETRYLDRPLNDRLDVAVTRLIRRSLAQDEGSLLVFLPGMAEIRRVERRLLEANLGPAICIAPLHGDLSPAAQDAAIAPAPPGTRKVVLATSIAETSLTIDGIRVVIDAGRLRVPRFDPHAGLTRLETIRVTQDSAAQRRGRAGRTEPGLCYRLWTEKDQAMLAPRRPPEILESDLAPLVLDLARWGAHDPAELSWLTPPPSGAVAQAKDLLTRLGALSHDGRLTEHGKQLAGLPLHPRLAHMLIKAMPLGLSDMACDLAALLGERDIVRGSAGERHADLRLRLDRLRGEGDHGTSGAAVDREALQRVRQTARFWRRALAQRAGHTSRQLPNADEAAGILLALAYPDRIAQRQPGHESRYLLTNGRGALFAGPDPLAVEPYLVIADLDGGPQWARINLAAPISLADIASLYAGDVAEETSVTWDDALGAVRASRRRRLGSLTLAEEGLPNPDDALVTRALLQGVRQIGLQGLAWTPELRQWRARIAFLRRLDGPDSDWPDLSNETLLRTLDNWLGPYLIGFTTLERARRLDLASALHTLLTWEQRRKLDRLAPTHITVPSGSSLRIDYETSDWPILAVRLQELFGCKDTPRVADGRVPLMLHLLSPAQRPVQVTQDLASFWINTYPEVRKELRGRYPKHPWPEDPFTARPTGRTTKQTG